MMQRAPLSMLVVLLLVLLTPWHGWAQMPISGATLYPLENDPTTGTEPFKLAKIASGKAVRADITDTMANVYVCLIGCGKQGQAVLVLLGETSCVMDATNANGMSGKPVLASTTQAGQCHVHTQTGAPSGMAVGVLLSESTTAGQTARVLVQMMSYMPASGQGGGGGGAPGTAERKVTFIVVGDPDKASPALSAGNDTPDGFTNRSGKDTAVVQMACKVNSGSVVIRPITTGGGDKSLLASDCTCGTTWSNCSVQTGTNTPVIHSFSTAGTVGGATCAQAPCGIDFNILSVDNVAKYLRIDLVTLAP